ncbi:MAG: hypothetical protein AAF415_07905 [Pseudomonadota bacterium]
MQMPPFQSNLPRDKMAEAGGDDLGPLPEWDLTDLYPAMDSTELTGDLDRVTQMIADFARDYEGKLADLDGDGLAGAIGASEAIDLILGRIMSYAGLLYQQNTTDMARAKFMGDMQAQITQATQPMGPNSTSNALSHFVVITRFQGGNAWV